ncbi:MAG: DNA polymerase IV [Clostridia bacterium]|nr:DNA polymerase IV [Clostridia bacterium]
MKDRVILHCDLNNFFASVSLLSNATLYNLPVAVCGSVEERHGIVLAKNEIAKKYGVKTAEAVWEAKAKCKDLVILAPDYKKYKEYSVKARKIYERYTDLIEPFGIDECWLDVTDSTFLFGSGEEIANKIRSVVKRELGITISVGVSFNKIFAKLGSDMKKPDAVTVISRENFKDKVWNLPAEDLLFVGKSTAEKLRANGIFTVGDITRCDTAVLERLLGKNGQALKMSALGEDNSPVTPISEDDKPKSVGRSVTPNHDITTSDEVWRIFLSLAEDISRQLRYKGLYACGIQLHTRNTALKVKETAHTFSVPVNSAMMLAKKAMELFKSVYKWDIPLRSVGFRAINLKDGSCAIQQDIFGDTEVAKKQEDIENSIQTVREKFGFESVKRGRIIND